MPTLPILTAADPTIIPAKTYDRIWIEEIVIRAPDPNGDIHGEVKLHKWIRIDNMLNLADSDSDLQNTILSLISYVTKIGQNESIISSD
jgi:hypothetical protein